MKLTANGQKYLVDLPIQNQRLCHLRKYIFKKELFIFKEEEQL